MARVLGYLLVLILLAVAALAVWSLVVDVPAPVREITIDVPLPPRT